MKSKENDETGRKRRRIEKKIECQEQIKLVEKLRPDRPSKNLGPGKQKKKSPGNSGLGRTGNPWPRLEGCLPLATVEAADTW